VEQAKMFHVEHGMPVPGQDVPRGTSPFPGLVSRRGLLPPARGGRRWVLPSRYTKECSANHRQRIQQSFFRLKADSWALIVALIMAKLDFFYHQEFRIGKTSPNHI
jgi:hypothetical protein